MRERDVAAHDLGVLCILMGSVTSVVFYRYGVDNHIAELPILLRAIDPSYLANDFYTNATAGYGPRYFFARFVALFASVETLAGISFGLCLAANIAIAAITATTARWWFGGSNLAGATAAAFVMSLSTFRLGFAPAIYVSQLLSSRAAAPLVLLALFAGLARRPVAAALCAGIAAFLHPTFGIEGGVIALAICAIAERAGRARGPGAAGRSKGSALRAFGAALALFVGLAAVAAWPSLVGERIGNAEFVAIETLFRHPHHSLLSEQSKRDFARACGLALLSLATLWIAHRESGVPRDRTLAGLALTLALSVGAPLGALLFEAFPERLLAVARPLRLLYLLKWWGLLLIGGLLAVSWQRRATRAATTPRLRLGVCLGAATCLGLLVRPSAGSALCLGLSAAAILGLWLPAANGAVRSGVRVAALACAFALVGQALVGSQRLPASFVEHVARLRPALSLAALGGDEAAIARAARGLSGEDAIFVTPPDTGLFRIVAERATVVDFKAFPFADPAMREWRERLRRCYGETRRSGFDAARELAARYRATRPEDLAGRGCDFGARFALIYRDTETQLELLAENDSYAIVALP